MLDGELHTSYVRQPNIPKDKHNVFEGENIEFDKMMMRFYASV